MGASEQFNKLGWMIISKHLLLAQLEGEIDALKSELTASLSVLEADIKGLIELPDIPDVSLISQIQGFAAPTGTSCKLDIFGKHYLSIW